MGYAIVGRLSQRQIERHIRAAAADSLKVVLTKHAKARMAERNITAAMVYECLKHGSLARLPEPNPALGTLECRLDRHTCGVTVGIVVAISDESPNLLVVTAVVVS